MMMNGLDSSTIPAVAATPGVDAGTTGSDLFAAARVEMLFDSLDAVIPEIDAFLAAVDELDGTIVIEGGVLTSNLETPAGLLQDTLDLPQEVNTLAAIVAEATGTATLENGVLVGDLTTGDDLLSGNVNIVELVSDALPDLLDSIEAEVPFENGQVAIATSTPFGEVSGNIDFGGGQLAIDLTTPFGPLEFTLDFDDDVQIPIDVNSRPGTIDLANGVVVADLFPGVLGNEISIPLTAFSGTLILDDGIANFTIPTVFGDFGGSIDVSQQILDASTDLLSSLNGTVSLAGGMLTSDLTTSAGALAGDFDVSAYLSEFAIALSDVNGTLTVADGILISDLTTPFGDIAGMVDLDTLDDLLDDDLVEDIEPPVEVPETEAIA